MVEDCSDSERLASLRLPLIIAVIYIHAYGGSYDIDNISRTVNSESSLFIYGYVTELISQCLSRVAVPMFFLMSGFFLFSRFNLSLLTYKRCLHSRLSTLFIPYIFWNSLILLLYWFFQTFTPFESFFSADNIIKNYSFFNFVDAFLGYSGYPIAYQFWFIRDLIILVFISPIIFLMINSIFSSFMLFIIFFIWLTGSIFIIPSVESLLFFSVGGYCALKFKTLFIFDRHVLALGFICSFIIFVYPLINADIHSYLVKAYIVFGTLFVLSSTRLLMYTSRLKNFLIYLSSSSFFIFAAHEPLLAFVKKLSISILPEPISVYYYLALYLLVPLIIVFLLCVFYFVLKTLFPKQISVISGR